MRRTYIIDADGVIFRHLGSMEKNLLFPAILEGVKEQFEAFYKEDAYIIILTGRKESSRSITEQALSSYGLQYDQLVMGAGRGPRIIINDYKPDSPEPTAKGISVIRNSNLKENLEVSE